MATPLTLGLRPNHLDRPAFPERSSPWSEFPTAPTVARHVVSTILLSPDGSLNTTYFPSRAASCANVPALLAMQPPLPGLSSIL
jgi:hypothetical protein